MWAVLCQLWMFIAWKVGMRASGMTVVGLGYLGVLLGSFGWATLELWIARRTLRVSIARSEDRDFLHQPPWQFHLGHLLLWTAIIAATLTAARYAFPPEPPEFLPSMLQYALRWDTQASLALQCLITVPLATAVVFRWRWLPASLTVAMVAIAVSVLFDHWRGNAPLTAARLKPTLISTVRMNVAYFSQAVPLLLVLRGLGYRLMRTSDMSIATSPRKAGSSR